MAVCGIAFLVAHGSMFAGNARPISIETIRRLTSSRLPGVGGGGEGTTAPIHPAGSGPGLPLSTHESESIMRVARFAEIGESKLNFSLIGSG